MLEKLLASVRRNPSDMEKVDAFIALLAQENDKSARGEGLAELAKILSPVHPLRALESIEVAFRLAPQNQKVCETLCFIIEARGDLAGRDKVKGYLRKLSEPRSAVPFRAPKVVPAQENSQATRIVSETFSCPASDFHKAQDEGTRVELAPREVVPASKSSSATGRFMLFKECVRVAQLPARTLEFAAEFADSLVGLVHFLSYLYVNGQLDQEQITRGASYIEDVLRERPEDLKAQARYAELIESIKK